MKSLLGFGFVLGLVSLVVPASAEARFGLGLGSSLGTGQVAGVNSIVARIEASPKAVLNVGLGFRSSTGDLEDSNSLGFNVGGQFRMFTNKAENLHFHALAGLGYTRTAIEDLDPRRNRIDVVNSEISLFGGVGAEYFFPGTDQFSMQIDVGPRIDILSVNPDNSPDADGTVLSLAENLSSGILFTYYFDMAAK